MLNKRGSTVPEDLGEVAFVVVAALFGTIIIMGIVWVRGSGKELAIAGAAGQAQAEYFLNDYIRTPMVKYADALSVPQEYDLNKAKKFLNDNPALLETDAFGDFVTLAYSADGNEKRDGICAVAYTLFKERVPLNKDGKMMETCIIVKYPLPVPFSEIVCELRGGHICTSIGRPSQKIPLPDGKFAEVVVDAR